MVAKKNAAAFESGPSPLDPDQPGASEFAASGPPAPPPSQPYLEKEPTYDARQAAHEKAVEEAKRRILDRLSDPSTYVPSPETVGKAAGVLATPFTWPADVAAAYAKSKLKSAEDANAPNPPTDLESKRAAEVTTGAMAPPPPKEGAEQVPASAPAPKAASSGGVGGYAVPSGPSPLERDFNERIGAMGEEEAARGQMARDVAGAYGGVEEQGRQNAEEQATQARDAARQQRAKIAEVDQLNRDYMNRTIDPDRFWNQMGVGQKIGTVLGGMFAGLGGGIEGARNFYNDLINRDLDAQKFEIENGYKGTQTAHNLLSSLQRTSDSEQEAMDKARAALYGAAMVEVARAGAAAKGPVEEAQVKELIADMKATRDASLAKLAAQRAAAMAAPNAQGMFEADPNEILTVNGQSYLAPKGDVESVRDKIHSYTQMVQDLQEGIALVQNRGALDYAPYSANLIQGGVVDGRIQQTMAKLAGARGVPVNIQQIARLEAPQFGDRDAALKLPKAEMMLRLLKENQGAMMEGLVPVDVARGGGMDKNNKNKLTTYVRERAAPAPSAAPASGPRPPPSFQPQ